MVIGELDIGPRQPTILSEEEIVGVIVQDTEVIMKISTTIPC